MNVYRIAILSASLLSSQMLFGAKFKAGLLNVEPYYSVIENKDKFTKASSGETVNKTRRKEEYGLRASVKLARFFQVQASYGENKSKKTEKSVDMQDTFDEIDFQNDLAIDVTDADADVSVEEHQKNAKLKLILNPSYSIFSARFYVGMNARWRKLNREQDGVEDVSKEYGPEYDPIAGAGFGVRLSRRIYANAEYELYFFKYPEFEPFEQTATVSFGLKI